MSTAHYTPEMNAEAVENGTCSAVMRWLYDSGPELAGIESGVKYGVSEWFGDKYNNPGLFVEDGVKRAVSEWIAESAYAQLAFGDGIKAAVTEWLDNSQNVDTLGAAIARHMRS